MTKPLESFSELIVGERVFRVPEYQRNYSWEIKQWKDFWDDMTSLENPRPHFLGTIILRKLPRPEPLNLSASHDLCDIIDGQQRICTSLILLKEIWNQLTRIGTEESEKEDLKDFERHYFKRQNIYKLELLGDDRDFFKRHIIESENFPNEKVTPSQRRLMDAKTFFQERLQDEEKKRKEGFKAFLHELREKIRRMEVLRYEVENTQDAVFLFETVNDRGKILSNLEKTKSFLMHMIIQSASSETPVTDTESKLNEINLKFSQIYRYIQEIIEEEKRARFIGEQRQEKEDAVQRYHFIFYQSAEAPWDYMEQLREEIRKNWKKDKDECLRYVLGYTADLEKAFFALKEIVTYNNEDNIGRLLERIFALGRVANFLPLLIAYWVRVKEKNVDETGKIEDLLRIIETYVVRVYVVGRRRANAGYLKLYELAYKIHHGSIDYPEVATELKSLIERYQNDNAFKTNLDAENFGKRVVRRDLRYLLFWYEEYLREQSKEPLQNKLEDILSENFTIEHIWAQDPGKLGLTEQALKDVYPKYVERLGNLTIAGDRWNSSMGNDPFEEKKKKYVDSSLRVQRELAKCSGWGEEQIKDRGKRLIEFISNEWKN